MYFEIIIDSWEVAKKCSGCPTHPFPSLSHPTQPSNQNQDIDPGQSIEFVHRIHSRCTHLCVGDFRQCYHVCGLTWVSPQLRNATELWAQDFPRPPFGPVLPYSYTCHYQTILHPWNCVISWMLEKRDHIGYLFWDWRSSLHNLPQGASIIVYNSSLLLSVAASYALAYMYHGLINHLHLKGHLHSFLCWAGVHEAAMSTHVQVSASK